MRRELRQQALRPVFSGVAKEHGLELQSAADGFFQNAHAFDGAVAFGCGFGMGEGSAQLFDEGIVASIDASQAAVDGGLVSGGFLQGGSCEIIRVYLSLQ